jgi:hypothetical protein
MLIASPAAADTGSVTGSVKLPDLSSRGEPPERNRGFLPRMGNPILPTKKYDPTPWMIIVLEPQDKLSGADAEPRKVPTRYQLVGEAFESPVFPTTVGGEVEIRNASKQTVRLTAPSKPDLLPGDAVNPGGDRVMKAAAAYEVVEVVDPDSTHLVGRVIAFPLRYHSRIDEDGNFSIDDVPAGDWTVKVWYRTGWLKMKAERVSVASRRGSKVSISLPDVIEIDPPGGAGEIDPPGGAGK